MYIESVDASGDLLPKDPKKSESAQAPDPPPLDYISSAWLSTDPLAAQNGRLHFLFKTGGLKFENEQLSSLFVSLLQFTIMVGVFSSSRPCQLDSAA